MTNGAAEMAWQGLYADIDGVVQLTNIVGPDGQSLKLQGGRNAGEAIAETVANIKAGEARRAPNGDPQVRHGDEPTKGRAGADQEGAGGQPTQAQRQVVKDWQAMMDEATQLRATATARYSEDIAQAESLEQRAHEAAKQSGDLGYLS